MCDKLEALGGWEFIRKLKADGRIKHYGFSFHDTPENLDTILTRHPDAEFVQLQINYLDWDDPKVQSRRLYETARRHNKPIIIMEPVKGGLLAGAGSQAGDVLLRANPGVSDASWAVRFAAARDGLITMLSGMNTMEQLQDNIRTIKNLTPLTEDELATVGEAVKLINSVPRVPCTGCRYCVDNCPQKLNIPFLIHIYNDYLMFRQKVSSGMPYMAATSDGRTPDTCVACRSCEEHCPQHIEISDVMGKMAELFKDEFGN
jgi:predicted aldo/keto reductase-like oxidoreductase